ncbi:MAG: preprotein translocase subunit SecY [Actinobacteria bacterium]|nr:preprotein translocase subunit SecY [Actinomycetota bacterium]
MAFFSTILNVFRIPELRRKILFTLGLLCIYRIGFAVPLPGVDQQTFVTVMGRAAEGSGAVGQMLNYFSVFTGGSLKRSTLFGLGIMPYISASIILQLLGTVIPSLQKLQQEGEIGRRKINEYTRYLTVAICIMQAIMWTSWLARKGVLVSDFGTFDWVIAVLSLTCGTVFMMWLGEQIDAYGIGNGISLIIMAGIVSRLPVAFQSIYTLWDPSQAAPANAIGVGKLIFIIACFVFVVAGAILITQGQRRIPIQQAKVTRGRRVFGGQRQYLPLRVNHGGVLPIIFAVSLMMFPGMIFGGLANWWHNSFISFLAADFGGHKYLYNLCYVLLIYFFAYFWTTVQFQPKEMAKNLRDYGSFIPGLRPGRRTAEYLEQVMERITYVGAAFLCIIAVIPTVIAQGLQIPFQISAFLGGTGLLIVISVALDLVNRIEANLIMRNYEGFLGESAGRIRGAY